MPSVKSMTTGVYAITHIASGKLYIGSAINFGSRWRIHKHHLRHNTHHSSRLQKAWNKYGETAFEFKKILICATKDLILYEQFLIDGYRSADRDSGYNIAAKAGSQIGYRHTDETKAKIKAKRAVQLFSEETKTLWSKNRKGRKMPDWFGEFTRSHRTGAIHAPEIRAIISAKGVGRPVPLASREKKSKVTFEQAQIIKARALNGSTQAQLATEFSLSQSTVSLIASGKRWANLPSTVLGEQK